MKKFFVLFEIPVATMDEWRKTTKSEEMKKQSEEMRESWKHWMETHKKKIIEDGEPIGKTKRITSKGITDTRSDYNWYLIVEADSHEDATKMLADHPHLQIPSAYIEVMEIPQVIEM